MDAVIKIGDNGKIGRILGGDGSEQFRIGHVGEDSFAVDAFARIHQVDVGGDRSGFYDIPGSQVIQVFLLG